MPVATASSLYSSLSSELRRQLQRTLPLPPCCSALHTRDANAQQPIAPMGYSKNESQPLVAVMVHETKKPTGSFNRSDASWRNWVSQEGAQFPAEAGRYHLYVADVCPWAHRTLLVRSMKGLEDTISVTFVMPTWQKTKADDPNDTHSGWVFADPKGEPHRNTLGLGGPLAAFLPHTDPDPVFGAHTVREIYEKCGDTVGIRSVPILFDKKLKTIVSNELSEIIRMLNSEFNTFATNPDLDLYPECMRKSIDAVNEWVYPTINNGVYRCGFAKTQAAYNLAITELTQSFDRIDQILQKQRFIAGGSFTEADLRLYVTLLRFDEVYIIYFKTNSCSVTHTPSIMNCLRDIYQMPTVKDMAKMEMIKMHYYTSHPVLNQWSIIPVGNKFEAKLNEPHNRAELFLQ